MSIVSGIGRNIGRCSVEQAKVWIIYKGFQFAWNVKWKAMIIEIECAITVKCIFGGLKGHSNRDLISSIREFYKRDWRVIIKQIPRETNFTSHILTRLTKDYPFGPQAFYVAPAKVVD